MTDAVVVGSGPNGLAAAVILARAGLSVELHERHDVLGGGSRTAELTLPGFRHDLGAAVHPMSLASPFFREFDLRSRIELRVPEMSYVQPFADGGGAVAYRDLDATVHGLGRDGRAWRSLLAPLVEHVEELSVVSGGHLLNAWREPLTALRLGSRVVEQAGPWWSARFRDELAPALLTGVMAHAIGPLPSIPPAAVGLALAAFGHSEGWPIPVGGSQAIIDAMAGDFVAHGGTIRTGSEVVDSRQIASAPLRVFDVSARALARIAAGELPARYARALGRFRYGAGVAKVDFALSEPVPWRNAEARHAATLHLGGTRAAMRLSEGDVLRGRLPEKPYILASQPTVVDPSRAPAGHHVLWAYVHAPAGSSTDPAEYVTRAVEEYAPGFADTILQASSMSAAQVGRVHPNFIGGDISAGALSTWQLIARPVLSRQPWRTPVKGMYLASSSTPPATGVHGMSGYHAATVALRDVFGLERPPLGPSR